jgi:tRNA threonylcarbamoyladenosine biosynthesis protein TsaB
MKVLIDTSLKGLTLVCLEDGKVVYTYKDSENRRVAEEIVPILKEAAEKNGKSFKDIGEIDVTDGPGSYTGERIGLAVAKVYSFLKRETLIKTASSLKIMTALNRSETVLALFDARNEAYFGGAYLEGKPLFAEKRMEKGEVEEFMEKNPSAEIAVLDSFVPEMKKRFPQYRIVGVDFTEAMVAGQDFFEKSDNPFALKARYLRGKDE